MAKLEEVQMEKVHKPSLNIRASVDSYGTPDTDYDKKRRKELKNEISLIERHLSNWDGEKVQAHAKADLENQLIDKKTQYKQMCSKKKLSMM